MKINKKKTKQKQKQKTKQKKIYRLVYFSRRSGPQSVNQIKRKERHDYGSRQWTKKQGDIKVTVIIIRLAHMEPSTKAWKGAGRRGNRRTNPDYANHSAIKISQYTKSPGDLRWLVVTMKKNCCMVDFVISLISETLPDNRKLQNSKVTVIQFVVVHLERSPKAWKDDWKSWKSARIPRSVLVTRGVFAVTFREILPANVGV